MLRSAQSIQLARLAAQARVCPVTRGGFGFSAASRVCTSSRFTTRAVLTQVESWPMRPLFGQSMCLSGLEQHTASSSGTSVPPPAFDASNIEKIQAAPKKDTDESEDSTSKRDSGRVKLGEVKQLKLPGSGEGGMRKIIDKGLHVVAYLPYNIMCSVFRALRLLVTNPAEASTNIKHGWGHFKEMMQHYWLGSKLLASDVRTATRLLNRVLGGHTLTRRERKQLLRTVTDVLRLVPFAFFVLVPFMELLLPVALKLFPNMLPSTFKKPLEREADMKRLLRARLTMASFLQEAVKNTAAKIHNKGNEESAKELMELFDAVRQGEEVPVDAITRVAQVFKDEITLDSLPRMHLQAMAQYMNLPAYGNNTVLRFQIRNHLRIIKRDDQSIMWEGIHTLNREELALACEERGMRSTGLTKTQYRRQLQQWLDLSVNRDVPGSLLILSRALTLPHVSPEQALKDSISAIEEDVLNEAVLESFADEDDVVVRRLKLESAKYQNELIEEEAEEAAAAEAAAAEAAAQVAQAAKEEGTELVVEEPTRDTAPELPADELEALTTLVQDSALATERALLEKATVDQEMMEASSLLAKGRIGAPKSESDPTRERAKDYVNSMLLRLESQLEQTETLVGSKLRLLDRNNDGLLSADELAMAISEILDGHSDEEAWAVVHSLDQDEDGMVSLEQFGAWAAERLEDLRAKEERDLEELSDEDSRESRRRKTIRRVLKP